MSQNESRISPFPTTQQDISRLMQTATDAVNDLGGSLPIYSVKEKIENIKGETRNIILQYPLRTLGAALAAGFIFGYLCRVSSEHDR